MIEVVVVSCTVVTVVVLLSHAFHSWLRQRERERLSSLDKAELTKRMDAYDSKLLELKNIVSTTRTR